MQLEVHVEIADFLSEEHFAQIVQDRQIRLDSVGSTEDLLNGLEDSGYEIIPFPGCVTSKQEYLDAISYGVVKVNLDTDLQYAYLTGDAHVLASTLPRGAYQIQNT